ncbi:unnamed protein product [Lasius platythorax]|uniref:Uncharacterized protein n=1 Tax=Lasius platythorax TaxID=488582 RepID=A0AAV2NDF8_9HYME
MRMTRRQLRTDAKDNFVPDAKDNFVPTPRQLRTDAILPFTPRHIVHLSRLILASRIFINSMIHVFAVLDHAYDIPQTIDARNE